jgi:hypothetical protein
MLEVKLEGVTLKRLLERKQARNLRSLYANLSATLVVFTTDL